MKNGYSEGKAFRVKMTDTSDSSIYYWTVRSFKNATNIVLGRKPRKISGWLYIDHEGYQRNVEGNWLELVDHFRLVASNYGLTSNIV